MNISRRFVPRDSETKAKDVSAAVIQFIQEENYYNIVIVFCEEHPDKIKEGEEICHVSTSPMSIEVMDELIKVIEYRNIIRYGGDW